MRMSLDFLHDGRPKRRQETREPQQKVAIAPAKTPSPEKALLEILSSPSIGSYEFISMQYDHEVQGTSVTKPLQGPGRVNADAGVLKPVASDTRGVVLAHGYAPSYSDLDPYAMAAAAIDTAIRNAIAAGAPLDHLAILDNFCWSTSNEPERLWQLKEAARACYDVSIAYGTPFISGKDSMFNDFRGYTSDGEPIHIAGMPMLLISAIGVMKDVRKAMTMEPKNAGDVVYLIGDTTAELGGSEYARRHGMQSGVVPQTDTAKNVKAYKAFQNALRSRLVASALPVTRGGLATAAAKKVLAGRLGLDLSLTGNGEIMLFSESQGRLLVTVPKRNAKKFEAAMKGSVISKIGTVTEEPTLSITVGDTKLALSLAELRKAYKKPFKNYDV